MSRSPYVYKLLPGESCNPVNSLKSEKMGTPSWKVWVGLQEAKTAKFWKAVISEITATAILMIVQCSVPLKWPGNNDSGTTVQIALGMGFVVMCLIEGFGHFSGAQVNPTVTLAMFVARKLSILKAILFILAQCMGSLLGSGLVYVVTPANATGTFATTVVNPLMSPAQGMVVEMYLSFMLVFVIFGATDSAKKITMPSLVIGLAVAMNICTGINHTGASMNPARSLGPAVYVNIWENHWVYWVGPIFGGILAAITYHYGFKLNTRNKNKQRKVKGIRDEIKGPLLDSPDVIVSESEGASNEKTN